MWPDLPMLVETGFLFLCSSMLHYPELMFRISDKGPGDFITTLFPKTLQCHNVQMKLNDAMIYKSFQTCAQDKMLNVTSEKYDFISSLTIQKQTFHQQKFL